MSNTDSVWSWIEAKVPVWSCSTKMLWVAPHYNTKVIQSCINVKAVGSSLQCCVRFGQSLIKTLSQTPLPPPIHTIDANVNYLAIKVWPYKYGKLSGAEMQCWLALRFESIQIVLTVSHNTIFVIPITNNQKVICYSDNKIKKQ